MSLGSKTTRTNPQRRAKLLLSSSADLRLDQLCDSAFENCRSPLLNLIMRKRSRESISACGSWKNDRYCAGNRQENGRNRWDVRILMIRAPLAASRAAIAPERAPVTPGSRCAYRTQPAIEHGKIMIFGAQNVVLPLLGELQRGRVSCSARRTSNYFARDVGTSRTLILCRYCSRSRFDDSWTNSVDTRPNSKRACSADCAAFRLCRIDPEKISRRKLSRPGCRLHQRKLAHHQRDNISRCDSVMYLRIADERAT